MPGIIDSKDKGEYVVVRGVYEGSPNQVKEAYSRANAVIGQYEKKIDGQLVNTGEELAFNLKVPKTLPNFEKAVTDLRKALE